MNQKDKFSLENETKRKYWFLRFKAGVYEITHNKGKMLIVLGGIGAAIMFWIMRNIIFNFEAKDIFSVMNKGLFNLMFPVWSIIGLLFLIALMGTPLGSKKINDNLMRIGLVNHAGETHFWLRKVKTKSILM